MLSRLDLESKGQGHSKNQKPMPWGTKNMPARRNFSRGSFSNWCDPDADADAVADTDTCNTICRPSPYGGVDIMIACGATMSTDFPTYLSVISWN